MSTKKATTATKQQKIAKLIQAIKGHKKNRTGEDKEGFYALTTELTQTIFSGIKPQIGQILTDGTNFATVVKIEQNGGDVRLTSGKLQGEELVAETESFGGGALLYNFFVAGAVQNEDFVFDPTKVVVIANQAKTKTIQQTQPAMQITENEATFINFVVENGAGNEVLGFPNAKDLGMDKKQLAATIKSLIANGGIKIDAQDDEKFTIAESAKLAAIEWLNTNPPTDEIETIEGGFTGSIENLKPATKPVKAKKTTPISTPNLPAEEVSAAELEERVNDIQEALTTKKGRGYANAGKRYDKSGVRIEEFMLGETKVKAGDKLRFSIGKEDVVGIFSHLNKCVHCPEGYVVVKFEGKNFERRQSRVFIVVEKKGK